MILCLKEPAVGIREKHSGKYITPLRNNVLPVSLMSVAGYIQDNLQDSDIRALDLANNGEDEKVLGDFEYGERPLQIFTSSGRLENHESYINDSDAILLSANFCLQREALRRTAEQAKMMKPGIKIICGGQDATRDPGHYAEFCDVVYTGSGLQDLDEAFGTGSGIVNGGFGGPVFPELGLEFIGRGLDSYNTSTEGPLPEGIDGPVIPLKMAAGCGLNCRPCMYPHKDMDTVFDAGMVKEHLEYAAGFGKILLLTDEIQNLPLGKVSEVIEFAKERGFFLDYGNTLELDKVAGWDEKTLKTLFGNGESSGCIGACTSFNIKALYDDGYRQRVFRGFEKINSSGAYRFSVNLAVGRRGGKEEIERAIGDVFEPMKSKTGKPLMFNVYFVKTTERSPFFMLPEDPEIGSFVANRLEEINGGELIDQNTKGYRYE